MHDDKKKNNNKKGGGTRTDFSSTLTCKTKISHYEILKNIYSCTRTHPMIHTFFIDFDLNNLDFYYHGLSVIIFSIIILLFLFIFVCRFCRVLRCYTFSLQRENANKYLT